MKKVGSVPYEFSVLTSCEFHRRIIGFDVDGTRLLARELVLGNPLTVDVNYTLANLPTQARGKKAKLVCCSFSDFIVLLVHTQNSLQAFSVNVQDGVSIQIGLRVSSLSITSGSSEAGQAFQYSNLPEFYSIGKNMAILCSPSRETSRCKYNGRSLEFFSGSDRYGNMRAAYGYQTSRSMDFLCQPCFPSREKYFVIVRTNSETVLMQGNEDSIDLEEREKFPSTSDKHVGAIVDLDASLFLCAVEGDNEGILFYIYDSTANTLLKMFDVRKSKGSVTRLFLALKDFVCYCGDCSSGGMVYALDLYKLASTFFDEKVRQRLMKIFPFACHLPALPTIEEILPHYAERCRLTDEPARQLEVALKKLSRLEKLTAGAIQIQLPHLALPCFNLPALPQLQPSTLADMEEAEEHHRKRLPQRASFMREYRNIFGPFLEGNFLYHLLAAIQAAYGEALRRTFLSQVLTCVSPGLIVPHDHDLPLLGQILLPKAEEKLLESDAAFKCAAIVTGSLAVPTLVLEQAPPCYRSLRALLEVQDPLARDEGHAKRCTLRRVLQASDVVCPRSSDSGIAGAEAAIAALRQFIRLSQNGGTEPACPGAGRVQEEGGIGPVTWEWDEDQENDAEQAAPRQKEAGGPRADLKAALNVSDEE